ncbi:hypothetical protein Tco_0584489 [Tanacetum coccineum]
MDHHDNPLLTKETESKPIIWDIRDEEEEYPFVNKYPSFQEEHIMLVEEESCPVYYIDNEEDAEPAPKYDSDVDELVYEDEELRERGFNPHGPEVGIEGGGSPRAILVDLVEERECDQDDQVSWSSRYKEREFDAGDTNLDATSTSDE